MKLSLFMLAAVLAAPLALADRKYTTDSYKDYKKYGKRVFGKEFEKYKPKQHKYHQQKVHHYGDHGYPHRNKTAPAVANVEFQCPNLKRCKNIDVPNVTPTFELRGPSGTICVYDRGNLNACNIEASGAFCRLDGKFFGPERVQCDLETGKCIVKGC